MRIRDRAGRRRGAAIEMALLLPSLALLAIGAVDYGRIFYTSATITSCARNGAAYASDPVGAAYDMSLSGNGNITVKWTSTGTARTRAVGLVE